MGDPRRLRNKIERPKRLWDKDRISHDKVLRTEYGLKKSGEIWRAQTAELKKYRREARRLLSLSPEERERDENKILTKLARLGIMKQGKLEDILGLEIKDVLERRLQTLVAKKGLARTMKQARQLITHGFIGINGKRITVPSYMVTVEEESGIGYLKSFDINAGMVSEEETEKPAEAPEEEKPEEKKEPEKKEEPKKEEAPKEEKKPEPEKKEADEKKEKAA